MQFIQYWSNPDTKNDGHPMNRMPLKQHGVKSAQLFALKFKEQREEISISVLYLWNSLNLFF